MQIVHTKDKTYLGHLSPVEKKGQLAQRRKSNKIIYEVRKCAHCDFRGNQKQLKKHYKENHPETVIVCEYCGDVFLANKQFKNHQNAFHQKCSLCNYKGDNLEKHYRNQHLNEVHICEICDKLYFTNEEYTNHFEKHKGCIYCDYFGNDILKHYQTEHIAKINKCPFCAKTFILKHGFENHLKIFHKNQRYNDFKCSKCRKSFRTYENLKTHVFEKHNEFFNEMFPSKKRKININ